MKIDFAQKLKTLYGAPLMRVKTEGDVAAQVETDLSWAAIESLLSVDPKQTLTGDEKARRYDLALKIQESSGPLDLSVDDIAFIKRLCDTHFAPLIVGQTRRLLDPKSD